MVEKLGTKICITKILSEIIIGKNMLQVSINYIVSKPYMKVTVFTIFWLNILFEIFISRFFRKFENFQSSLQNSN